MNPSPPVLRCRGVRRAYATAAGDLEVLDGVDLEVESGEVVAVLGPSGSGKSTLMHLLAGLDVADAGEIWWGELAVHDRRPQDLASVRARRVGMVFQQHYLLDELTVRENIGLPGRIHDRVDPQREHELLRAVGLEPRADAWPRTLSGGERQRVAVARALFHRPPLILADEPTGSLDRANADRVYRLLGELARDAGSALVVVTHDEALVADADRRYRLAEGRLRPARPTEESVA